MMKFSTRRALTAMVMMGACVASGWVSAADTDGTGKEKADDTVQDKLLVDGIALMKSGDAAGALRDFDQAIALNERRIAAAAGKKVYAARTQAESLVYLLEASQGKQDAVVYASQMTYAHFMKAYVFVDQHRDDEAKTELDAALSLSPRNAQVLGETGTWYLRHRDWDHALQTYQRAQDAASLSTPAGEKFERGVALRGIGYVYVEQHKLDDAERIYLQCLEVDAGDKKAANELAYVRAQKAKDAVH